MQDTYSAEGHWCGTEGPRSSGLYGYERSRQLSTKPNFHLDPIPLYMSKITRLVTHAKRFKKKKNVGGGCGGVVCTVVFTDIINEPQIKLQALIRIIILHIEKWPIHRWSSCYFYQIEFLTNVLCTKNKSD